MRIQALNAGNRRFWFLVFVNVTGIQCGSQRNPAICPGFQTEIHDPTRIQIIDDIREQTAHQALTILVRDPFPQAVQLVYSFDAHCQFGRHLSSFGSAGFPVGDFPLIGFADAQILFAVNFTIFVLMNCRVNPASAEQYRFLLLLLDIIFFALNTAGAQRNQDVITMPFPVLACLNAECTVILGKDITIAPSLVLVGNDVVLEEAYTL